MIKEPIFLDSAGYSLLQRGTNPLVVEQWTKDEVFSEFLLSESGKDSVRFFSAFDRERTGVDWYYLSEKIESRCDQRIYFPFYEGCAMPTLQKVTPLNVLLCAQGMQYLVMLEGVSVGSPVKRKELMHRVTVGVIKGREVIGFETLGILDGKVRLEPGGFYSHHIMPGTFVLFALNFLVSMIGHDNGIRLLGKDEHDANGVINYAG